MGYWAKIGWYVEYCADFVQSCNLDTNMTSFEVTLASHLKHWKILVQNPVD